MLTSRPQKPHYLLDRAKIVTGSDTKTAAAVFQAPPVIADWRSLRQKIPIADVVILASIARLDHILWCKKAIAKQHFGTAKGKQLEMIFGLEE